jgi:hypothetical protein
MKSMLKVLFAGKDHCDAVLIRRGNPNRTIVSTYTRLRFSLT